MNQCYMCGADATSKEHVPARCFFPDGSSYRKQLITVPSCTLHNEDTSLDDEYVRNVVAMSIGTNAVAFGQFLSKTVESFKKSPKLFRRTTSYRKRIITPQGGTLAFRIERDRVDKVFRKIAYALYFNENGDPWNRELIVMSQNLRNEDMSLDDYGKLIQDLGVERIASETEGENPEVFQYRFYPSSSEDKTECTLYMKFYEGFEVWISVVQTEVN